MHDEILLCLSEIDFVSINKQSFLPPISSSDG